ncbi:MAG: hypothetical protein GF346_12870 [Candidatus Eisenbacteria bacterium]|nr:hypothetical protein [Candidatus Latescibacterota bacterium]MBD3303330.1 hypothetical protein [Candidatus Eisenbacteria bacterium]
MASHASPRAVRSSFLLWLACAVGSIALLATPIEMRRAVSGALEWSVFLPARLVLGWGGRSLLTRLENQQLSEELTYDRLRVSRLEETARENEALRRMVGMTARAELRLVPARVVGRSADWSGEVLWAEHGGGVVPGRAAVAPDGLVGRTVRVAEGRVWIETLWHRRLAVSVVDARSREQGILRWNPADPEELTIDPVPVQGDYRVGDPILTSGLGEIFPEGILVGHVVGADLNPRTQLKRIRVRPAVSRGDTRELFLVRERPPASDGSTLTPIARGASPTPPPIPGGPRIAP